MIPDDEPRLVAARDLTDAINGMSDRLDRAEETERKTMRLFWGAIALILAVGIGLAIWTGLETSARESSDRAAEAARIAQNTRDERQIARLARDNCTAANRTRAEDLAFEKRFIPDALAGTPGAKAETARLLAAVRVKDAQRDCAALAGGT